MNFPLNFPLPQMMRKLAIIELLKAVEALLLKIMNEYMHGVDGSVGGRGRGVRQSGRAVSGLSVSACLRVACLRVAWMCMACKRVAWRAFS